MKQSDLNYLRRLLGWIRCEIGQGLAELQQTMIDVAEGLGHPEIGPEAKARLVETYRRAESIPLYVRAAVKALEEALAAGGRDRGVETASATAETRANIGFYPGADAGHEAVYAARKAARNETLEEISHVLKCGTFISFEDAADYIRTRRTKAVPYASEGMPDQGSDIVNEACWRFVEVMPHPLPGPIFNSLKPALYAAICHVLADRQQPAGDAACIARLRAALILARDSHGVSLLTDPPQDAWKARGVDDAIRAALSTQPTEQPANSAPSPTASPHQATAPGSQTTGNPRVAAQAGQLARAIDALERLTAECARADAQAAKELQRTFIYPDTLAAARRVLAAIKQEGGTC